MTITLNNDNKGAEIMSELMEIIDEYDEFYGMIDMPLILDGDFKNYIKEQKNDEERSYIFYQS